MLPLLRLFCSFGGPTSAVKFKGLLTGSLTTVLGFSAAAAHCTLLVLSSDVILFLTVGAFASVSLDGMGEQPGVLIRAALSQNQGRF